MILIRYCIEAAKKNPARRQGPGDRLNGFLRFNDMFKNIHRRNEIVMARREVSGFQIDVGGGNSACFQALPREIE
jgi:hypothetical protein